MFFMDDISEIWEELFASAETPEQYETKWGKYTGMRTVVSSDKASDIERKYLIKRYGNGHRCVPDYRYKGKFSFAALLRGLGKDRAYIIQKLTEFDKAFCSPPKNLPSEIEQIAEAVERYPIGLPEIAVYKNKQRLKHVVKKYSMFNIIEGNLVLDMAPHKNVVDDGVYVSGDNPWNVCPRCNEHGYVYNKLLQTWRCSCGANGGKLEFYAIKNGIFTCDHAGKGCLAGENGRSLIEMATEDGHLTDDDIKKLLPPYLYLVVKEVGKKDDKHIVREIHLDTIKYATFLKDEFHIINFNKRLWIYDDNRHYYRMAANELETHHHDVAEEYFIVGSTHTKAVWGEISHLLKSAGCHLQFPFNRVKDAFPVENGIIHFMKNAETGNWTYRLESHGPQYLFSFVMPVKYDKTASTAPVTRVFTEWVIEEKNIRKLRQILARGLFQTMTTTQLKIFTVLLGEHDCGKTQMMALIRLIAGLDQCTAVTLLKICNGRFDVASLESKLVNASDELEKEELKKVEGIKNITGSPYHHLEKKFQDPYDSIVTCTCVFATNTPPTVSKDILADDAFTTRIDIVQFPREFPRDPLWQERTFTADFLSGYLNLTIDEILKIYEGTEPIMPNADEVANTWLTESDPYAKFIRDNFIDSPIVPNWFDKEKVRLALLKFCKDHDYPMHLWPTSKEKFGRRINAHHLATERYRVRDNKGKDIWSYEGLYGFFTARNQVLVEVEDYGGKKSTLFKCPFAIDVPKEYLKMLDDANKKYDEQEKTTQARLKDGGETA